MIAAICCLLALTSLSPAQNAATALVTQAVDNAVRTTLPGNVHPLARPEFDRGEAPPDLPMKRMLLVLKRSDAQETALRRLIDDQQDKHSPHYHKWLTPTEFGAQFGPADSDITAVTNWLAGSGFEVTQISNGRTVIEFSGTAGLVKQAFATAIHKFVVNGESHWANANDPSIPTALAQLVTGVDSLHNFPKKAMNRFAGTFSKDKTTGQVTPLSPQFTFPAGCFPVGQNCDAVGPYDFATIYDLTPLWNAGTDGSGQTIAIVGRTNINPQDATDFWNLFGLPVAPNKLTITLNGPDPGINGDEGEADIDTQWSGAVAPGASINFVTSASTDTTDGVDLSAIYIVDNNLAPVMSTSYGLCELGLGTAGNQFFNGLWEQAAAQGISSFVSTGDNGAAGCDVPAFGNAAQFGLNVNGLASTPFNTAVGGTDFNQYNKWSTYWNSGNDIHQASAKSYIPENTWNDSCTNNFFVVFGGFGNNAEAVCNNNTIINDGFVDTVGGSGGRSNCVVNSQQLGTCAAAYAKPGWQTGTGTQTDHVRDLPDVSMFASDGFTGSFYIVCQSDTAPSGTCDLNSPFADFAGFGGTSVSTPAFAGIMALVNQKWGSPQGNAGFVLYKLAASKPSSFHDTPSGSTNSVPCFAGTPNCTVNVGGDQFGLLSGFNTAANYDLATGLGSVDANTFVNNWGSVTFTSTTTTLQLNAGNPVNVAHGASVPVQIGVTPTSATGDADLLVYVGPGTVTGPGIDFFQLTGGAFSGTTSALPGGTYNIVARYAGDGTFGGSYSAPMSVTVNPEDSSVYMPGVITGDFLASPPQYTTSVAYGSPYVLRADVKNAAGNFCNPNVIGSQPPFTPCPTGTVAFTDNGNPLDNPTYPLSNLGTAVDETIQLTRGSHTLVGHYSGDPSFKASASPNVVITVAKATTYIGFVSSPGSAAPNQSFTLSTNINTSSSGLAPGGTVTFLANGSQMSGTPVLTPTNGGPNNSASLAVSLTTSLSNAGTYSITVNYSGDTNYLSASQSNAATVAIFDFTVPATLTDPAPVSPGQSATTSMTITPAGQSTFTNNVIFTCSGLPFTVSCGFNPTSINSGSPATTVQVSLITKGPFVNPPNGPERVRRASVKNPRLWLPLSLPLASVVLVGLAEGRVPRRHQVLGLCLALLLTALLVACGGGGGGSSPPPPVISVSVSPTSVTTLYPNLNGAPPQTQQFTATVHNSSNQGVNWSVNGVAGGNDTFGTIDGSGMYTAPVTLPTPTNFNVTAAAQADPTKTADAGVFLQTPTASGTYPITIMVTEGAVQHSTTLNLTVQ